MEDRKRELGKIDYAKSGPEDHGIITCSIGIVFEGSHQGFGNLCLNKKLLPLFEEELCNTFGVKNLKDLVGQECYALRCFDSWNSNIEGLESVKTGKKFIISSWRKKYVTDFKHKNPLEEKRDYLLSRIESAHRQIADAEAQLSRIDREYKSWE